MANQYSGPFGPMGSTDDCSAWWALADHLPINSVLAYWCGVNPDDLLTLGYKASCVEAKRQALLSACERGEVDYTRSDRKPFFDPARELDAKGALLIERASFVKWLEAQQIASPLPAKPLGASERDSMLVVVAALAKAAGIELSGRGAATQISRLTDTLGAAVSDDTVGRILKGVPDAIENVQGRSR